MYLIADMNYIIPISSNPVMITYRINIKSLRHWLATCGQWKVTQIGPPDPHHLQSNDDVLYAGISKYKRIV